MLDSWHLLESRDAFRNRWLHVTLDTVQLPDGMTYEYTTIRRDAVGVGLVVFNRQNQLLLEQEYRHPVGEIIYQLPGGLAVASEDPELCIRRELLEETGLVAGDLRYLGRFWNNPASSNGECLLYLAHGAEARGQASQDTAEFITWSWYDLAWVKERVLDGTIKDRVVLCALTFLMLGGELM